MNRDIQKRRTDAEEILRRVRVVVFDVDGTLVDSVGCIISCMQEAAAVHGARIPTDAEVLDIIGITLRAAVARLFPMESDQRIDIITDEYRRLCTMREDANPSPYFPGTVEALERLKTAGYFIAIATGKSRRGLMRLLADERIRRITDFSVCGDEAPSKPDPGMMRLTMEHFGLRPEQLLMVGDSALDLAMAKNASVPSVGVTCGVHDSRTLNGQDPVLLAENPAHLARILTGI